MELSEKIQKLRKDRGLTQEQFAELLFVSRTAVSKWETGRGIPSVESLQLLAKLCGVTLDELLQAEEMIAVAKNENKENLNRFAACMDGVFNLAAAMSLFLPLYKIRWNGMFHSVALYQYTGWLAILYWIFPVAMILCGMIQLITNRWEKEKLRNILRATGVSLNICAVFVFILSGQPYPGAMFFALLLLKAVVFIIKEK